MFCITNDDDMMAVVLQSSCFTMNLIYQWECGIDNMQATLFGFLFY